MDTITITGIRQYGYTGLLAEEQVLGQWFEVNLTLGVDLSIAGMSDRLDDTVDYREAIAKTKHLIAHEKFALIERLAQAIADQILAIEGVQQVRVELAKLHPPIVDFGGRITIDITRHKP